MTAWGLLVDIMGLSLEILHYIYKLYFIFVKKTVPFKICL